MKLVEFPLEEMGTVIIEVHEPDGPIRAGAKEKVEQAKETLEAALNKVLPATKSVVEKVSQASSKPDEIEICFGINLSTVAGSFIAASAEANFSVTMRWTGASAKSETATAPAEGSK